MIRRRLAASTALALGFAAIVLLIVLEPPLLFRVRPAVLRCRVARHHRGASPSSFAPDDAWAAVRTLAAIATGHEQAR